MKEIYEKLDRVSDSLVKVTQELNSVYSMLSEIENNKQQEIKEEIKIEETKKEITIDDITEAIRKHAKKHGKGCTLEIIKIYGATKISEIKKEDYENVIEALI